MFGYASTEEVPKVSASQKRAIAEIVREKVGKKVKQVYVHPKLDFEGEAMLEVRVSIRKDYTDKDIARFYGLPLLIRDELRKEIPNPNFNILINPVEARDRPRSR